jgi:hypothetical protein
LTASDFPKQKRPTGLFCIEQEVIPASGIYLRILLAAGRSAGVKRKLTSPWRRQTFTSAGSPGFKLAT